MIRHGKFRLGTSASPIAALAFVAISAFAQQQSTPSQTPAPIHTNVSLVPIRVVVRDNTGAVIPNLKREDFQILEDGKPQQIAVFDPSVPNARVLVPVAAPSTSSTPATVAPSIELPSRYIALVFDDVHLETSDLVRARAGADKFLGSAIDSSTRIAVLTMSGQDQAEFTGDSAALRKAIDALIPRPVGVSGDNALGQCPPMDYYEADLIINRDDKTAQQLAQADALICTADQSAQAAYAQMMSTAHQLLAVGDANAQSTMRRLDEIVTQLAKLPGQRNILLISPGFLTTMYQTQLDELIDRAARAGIFIHTLDARGLFATTPLPESNNPGAPTYTNARSAGMASAYRRDAATQQDNVMRDLAHGTGGFAFLDNNDLDAGFTRTVGHPEASYLIAFAPIGLKNDGKFHELKVKLATKNNYVVEARRGFYAPNAALSPEDTAKQRLDDAAFSQETIAGLPIDLALHSAMNASGTAKLFVEAHISAAGAQFDEHDGHRSYNFAVVTALFDSNGAYLAGTEKNVELRLKDPTPERLVQGVTIRSTYEVRPGPQFVRLVVRENKSGALAAKSGAINITARPIENAALASPAPAIANFPGSAPPAAGKKSATNSPAKPAKKSKGDALEWDPPDTDARVAGLTSGVPCPVSELVIAAGERASELSNNLERFDALETTAYESFERYGVRRSYIPASFDYTVEFDRKPGIFQIMESRTPTRDSKAGLGAVADSGVAAVALIFHPFYRIDFEMHCDGASDWDGHPAWLVRFRQIKGAPSRILAFTTKEATYPAKLKGRAWIAQDSGQILHLEANLEEGIPIMNLESHAISIDYAPVQFQSQRVELWLPQRATSYTEYLDHRTLMHHEYSDFKLFSVQSTSAVAAPKISAPASPDH
jgi:VWFA-related protein